jgi:hypothetical protein
MAPKMAGEFQKSDVLFTHVVENANRALLRAGKPYNLASRPAELARQRLYSQGRCVEMPLKKFLKNVHKMETLSSVTGKNNDNIARTMPTERKSPAATT